MTRYSLNSDIVTIGVTNAFTGTGVLLQSSCTVATPLDGTCTPWKGCHTALYRNIDSALLCRTTLFRILNHLQCMLKGRICKEADVHIVHNTTMNRGDSSCRESCPRVQSDSLELVAMSLTTLLSLSLPSQSELPDPLSSSLPPQLHVPPE